MKLLYKYDSNMEEEWNCILFVKFCVVSYCSYISMLYEMILKCILTGNFNELTVVNAADAVFYPLKEFQALWSQYCNNQLNIYWEAVVALKIS